MFQSLIASLLCGVIVIVLFRLHFPFKQNGVTMLMPKITSSVRICPLPKPKLSADETLQLLIEHEDSFQWYVAYTKKRAAMSGLRELHKSALPVDDLELRVWELPSTLPPQAFVLTRTNGKWQGRLLRRMAEGETHNPTLSQPEPAIGWEAFWKNLVKDGILTLPHALCLRDYDIVMDGTAYVVEINLNGAYRFYGYGSPQVHQSIPEPDRMWKIVCTIFSYYYG
ncbi:MAG: hypothetical protein JNK38_27785 [Acidobacteria bacterium]|nr:hypothetical protein [Acidobacteriota bacterium]